MIKKFWYLFLVLLIEGSSLMSVELLGAKLLAPFFGSSLYVWTAVLCITVLGLTLGYYFGGQLSAKYASEKLLILILAISAILAYALPVTADMLILINADLGLIPGIIISSFVLLVPPMFCFGLVGPMVVRLMAQKLETLGNVAGTVYFTSTLGGIVATFLFGFFWIPEMGLKFSALITAMALASLPVVYFAKTLFFKNISDQSVTETTVVPPIQSKPNSKGKPGVKVPGKIKSSIYLFAALEGATVMAVELMAARMLAPYFGSSLFVWAAVIGITLLSLAFGYFAGGRLADKFTRIETIYWVILIASIFLMLMHYISQRLTLASVALDMRIGVVIVSILLVLPPLLFLGMIPTLLIRFLTANVDGSGRTTGRVFTISSASGILALPIMGFLVIPEFGLTGPSIFIGFLVGIVPFIKLISNKKYISLLFLVFILFSVSQRVKTISTSDLRVLSFSEGLLGQVLVADVFKDLAGRETNDRVLFLNRMGQSIIDKNTNRTRSNSCLFASTLSSVLPENSKALVLGLGGGNAANIFHDLNFKVEAVELDPRIATVARKYFDLYPDINVIIDDARHYIETTRKTYDLIFIDVFKGDIQPPHVMSLEFFKKVKSLLNKDGLIIVNIYGYLNDEIGKPGRSLYLTLQAAGFSTKIFPTPGKEDERNCLFVASSEPKEFHQVRAPLRLKGNPVDLETLFYDINTLNLKDAIIFTDDKPNLDRLNIKAANAWRQGYNETYTTFFADNGVPLFN